MLYIYPLKIKLSLLSLVCSLIYLETAAMPVDPTSNGSRFYASKGAAYVSEPAPYIVVENQDNFPAPDHLTFSNIQIPWNREGTPQNRNHNRVQLRISNRGASALTITKLQLSDGNAWRIVRLGDSEYNPATALPATIKPASSVMVVLEFIAKNQSGSVKVLHGTLRISSNDALAPEKEVFLHGLWQRAGEGSYEPNAQEIINTFGFKTNTGYGQNDGSNDGKSAISGSDEIMSSFFVRADASRPVEVIQMAAYHGCCSQRETFKWYTKGSGSSSTLFTHDPLDGQSLLPKKNSSSTELARGTFNPSKPFGFQVASAYSDRTRNHEGKIGMRIWKAIDANGNVIPNAYIIGTDYLGTEFTNFDYQDNVYFVRNIRPETGTAHYSELAAKPSAVHFDPVSVNSSAKVTVNLQNTGTRYDNGSSDPSIQIKKIEIVGPDRNQFSAVMPDVKTLGVQAAANAPVEFRPTSYGLKNATLLIHFTNGASPLRIPLYGVANSGSDAITAAKRIKGAADANMTIGGNIWEADRKYRKGSIKLDKQVVAGPIAGTDDDVLYQTYLSAAKDLEDTGYEIPIDDGAYVVRMHFVENYWSAVAARMFNIIIEDELRLQNLDIYKEVGYRTALVKDFNVNVSGGKLNIQFDPTVNRLAIAGLEIYNVNATVTGVDPETEGTKRHVLVYPNPGEGEEVQVVIKNFDRQEELNLTLHDVSGRTVYSKGLMTDNSGEAKVMFPTAPFHKGVYFVRVNAPSGKAHVKLLIK